jgi:hypothetical protein
VLADLSFVSLTVIRPFIAAVSVTVLITLAPSRILTLPVGPVMPSAFTVTTSLAALPAGTVFLARAAVVVDVAFATVTAELAAEPAAYPGAVAVTATVICCPASGADSA